MNSITKTYKLPTGGTVKITISQVDPIDESQLPILQDCYAVSAGESLKNLAGSLKPKPKVQ